MSKIDCKVVMLGATNVGKTCLVQRLLHDNYTEDVTATVGAAFGAKKLVVQFRPVTLGVWDTAGAERFESMSRIYYRGAKAACVCYDVTSESSWEKVRYWVDQLRSFEEDCTIFLVGCKVDKVREGKAEREISAERAESYAVEVGAKWCETSARSGLNVKEVFTSIAEDYLEKNGGVTPASPSKQGLVEFDGTEKSGCC